MAEIDKRDEIHVEGSTLWLEGDRKNSLIFGTGTGKSKIAIDILKKLFAAEALNHSSKILLLTNSTDLRDNNWKAEFIKWDAMDLWEILTSECYQTAYKWNNTVWDFVIADEVDFCLTDSYGLFFQNNLCDMILGLTGFIDDSKRVALELIAPVLMEYSTQDAQDAGMLNGTQIVFVKYNLCKDKTIEVKYKDRLTREDKTFLQSENDAYEYIENTCNISWGEVTSLESKLQSSSLNFLDLPEIKNNLAIARAKNRRATMDRKKLLFSGTASLRVAKTLLETILVGPTNKALIFSMRTEQGAKISLNTYNGTNKKGNTCLEDLSSGKIRELAVCKAIDRGTNLVGVNNEIMESFEGSETAFNQRHGRGCRLLPGQTMYLYIMLPYYMKKVKSKDAPGTFAYRQEPTQMVKWAAAMMQSYRLNTPITIIYDERRNNFISG